MWGNKAGVCAVLMVVFLCGAMVSEAAIPTSERDALIALYNSTGGPGWNDATNWLGAAGTECTWVGVVCDGGETHVLELNLGGNNLIGVIPTEVVDLSALVMLRMPWNGLQGGIPVQIGSMSVLERLNLRGNQLIGEIPTELGNLSNLTRLALSNNQLSGSIPPALGSLSNLTGLWLNDNRLTGSIPSELGTLGSLEEIHLWGNRLSGGIPTSLASVTTLNWVDLAGNRLTGSIPPEFGSCPALAGLVLGGNQLDGTIPVELGSASSLQMLELSGNQLSGSIPPELGNLGNLNWLSLNDNRLSGSIPPELGSLANLTDLLLHNNSLDGAIPPEIGNLASLGHLNLQRNNLTGAVPPELGNLVALGHLDLGQNHLSGSIPSEIGALVNLGFLNLSSNALSGSIPPEIGGLVNLGELFLAWNRLSGTIPPEIGALGALWGLDLGFNHLEGQIPAELGNLGNLQWMNLRSNKLMGPLPPTITNLTSLGDNSSDIRMNGLYSSDSGVVAFLDAKCGPDWKQVQTVMPVNLSPIGATGLSVTLAWSPIAFSWNPGGYDIFISESPSGPFLHAGRAVDKTADAWTVFGLLPSTTYHFKICAVTEANAENPNTVTSELTAPLAVATTSAPSTWYAATTGVVGNDCASPATPCPTIQTALGMAGPGEVVHIAPGTYTETLGIDKAIMLVGADPATTIIEGWGWAPVVDVFPFSQLDLSGVTIRNGQVQFGAGVFVGWRGRLEMRDAVVTQNSAQIMGGGVYVECEAGAVLERVSITGNTAGERAGGLGACGYTQLIDSSVTQNSAPWGGGVAINGPGRIEGSTVAANTATDFGGGGVVNEGWLTVVDSAIHGNSASLGGGLANMQWANVMLENSTVSGNEGGGLFNDHHGVAGLDGCTVADNSGLDTEHSGVMNWDSVALHATILAGNSPVDCANPVTSYGYNMESGTGCGLDGPGDVSGTDPLLGPLADNGGPTWTHALGAGSPAVDAGDPAAYFATDQRGYPRPIDGDEDGTAMPDVGAVEFAGPIFMDGFESGDTTGWSVASP